LSNHEVEIAAPTPPRVPQQRPGKRGGKRDENRRRKVQQLCDAALGQMLQSGVEAVTVEQIAKSAGVAKGSFYRYFEDKEELVGAIVQPLAHGVEQAFDACANAIDASPGGGQLDDAYSDLASALEAVLLGYPREILLYLQECRGPRVGARAPVRDLADRIAERAVELTVAAQNRQLLRAFPERVSGLSVVGATERLLFEVLSGGDVGVPREAARRLIELVMDGLRIQ